MRYILNGTLWLLKFALVLLLIIAFSVYFFLRGSLPQLSGEYLTTYLNEDVVIERDAKGIPTIKASNRAETAFALGFLHGQERFFQMDLQRRRAAGELAELLGDEQLETDRKNRIHRFRHRARQALQNIPPQHVRILQAYTDGINTGLESLSNAPFEYMLLGISPQLWEPEDSLLSAYSMYLELNGYIDIRERSLALMKDLLPAEWYRFLTPSGGEWDAPLQGEAYANLTQLPKQPLNFSIGQSNDKQLPLGGLANYVDYTYRQSPLPGSNNWAVSGQISPYRSALLANDIHLPLREPNIWYRASWFLQDGRRVTGVTIPGIPAMVIGSNENIAWGFTNSYGDWGDLVPLTLNEDKNRYLTDAGWQDFSIYTETIRSRSGKEQQALFIDTIWGPVIGRDHKGRLLSYQWVAHTQNAVNLELIQLETSNTSWETVQLAPKLGIPSQNLLVTDHKGNIAWTISGVIPRRDDQPAEHQDEPMPGTLWTGLLDGEEYPRIINPAFKRLWTANNRVTSDSDQQLIRFDGGDMGARAQQIRDTLFSADKLSETDFFAIQMDNRALLLQRWAELLKIIVAPYGREEPLAVSEQKPSAVSEQAPSMSMIASASAQSLPQQDASKNGHSDQAESLQKNTIASNDFFQDNSLAEIKAALTDTPLIADKSSLDYLLVTTFRNRVINQAIGWIYDTLERYYPEHFRRSVVDNMIEYPVWSLISQRPLHLLPAGYNSWDEFLQSAARETYRELALSSKKPVLEQTWGDYNILSIQHPFSLLSPILGFFLDMSNMPMSGDNHMPNVYSNSFGATLRMVVSPGYEINGFMQMPTGQSAHPLSPYYSRGHEEWVNGDPSGFLPGETEWTLLLKVK